MAESGNEIEFSSPSSGFTRISTSGTNMSIRNDAGNCLALSGYGGNQDTACLDIINNGYGDAIKSVGNCTFTVRQGEGITFKSTTSNLLNMQILYDRTVFAKPIYFRLDSIPNISGDSNYYLCINRSTGRLSYR